MKINHWRTNFNHQSTNQTQNLDHQSSATPQFRGSSDRTPDNISLEAETFLSIEDSTTNTADDIQTIRKEILRLHKDLNTEHRLLTSAVTKLETIDAYTTTTATAMHTLAPEITAANMIDDPFKFSTFLCWLPVLSRNWPAFREFRRPVSKLLPREQQPNWKARLLLVFKERYYDHVF